MELAREVGDHDVPGLPHRDVHAPYILALSRPERTRAPPAFTPPGAARTIAAA